MALRNLRPLLSASFQQAQQFSTNAAGSVVAKKDWKSVEVPKKAAEGVSNITHYGQAYVGDLRATSALGLGDGLKTHTEKWLLPGNKSPMEYIQETKPIKVEGLVVASYGSDDPALGCPVEYICLKGTTEEKPAVCKYTGNKYYSDTWKYGAHHH